MLISPAYEAFELARVDLMSAAKIKIPVSIRAHVEQRKDRLRRHLVPRIMYAEALFLGAAHLHLAIDLDYPLPPRSLGDDPAGVVAILRAQALLFRGNLREADDLIDRTMRFCIDHVDGADRYRSDIHWLFDVMRGLAASAPAKGPSLADYQAGTVH